jgi:hypothetical protein
MQSPLAVADDKDGIEVEMMIERGALLAAGDTYHMCNM